MAGLADFSADDIINSDDTGPNSVNLAGPGTVQVGGESASQGPASEASGGQAVQVPGESGIDSSAIENLLAPKTEPDPEDVKASEQEQPEAKKEEQKQRKRLSPAQERIQALIAERNAAQEEAARYQAQALEIQRQTAEQQAKFQQEQIKLEQRRLELMEQQRREEEESRLSEVEKARRQFLREAEEKATGKLSPELQQLKAEVAALREAREKAEVQAQQAQRLEMFRSQANAVLDGVLLKGFEPEEQKALGSGMEEMLYAFSGAFGVDPTRAAPVFKQFLDRYVKAENSRVARTAGTRIAESRQAPKSVPPARASGGAPTTGRMPTIAELQRGTADGRTFDNHVQWFAAGRPALRA
jgi:hypothetical protein